MQSGSFPDVTRRTAALECTGEVGEGKLIAGAGGALCCLVAHCRMRGRQQSLWARPHVEKAVDGIRRCAEPEHRDAPVEFGTAHAAEVLGVERCKMLESTPRAPAE